MIFISLHIIVNIKGKDILTAKLEGAFKKKVTIASVTTSFPLDLHIKGLEVENLFKIDELVAGGGVLDIFRRSFRLSSLKIIKPEVYIERAAPGKPIAKVEPAPQVNYTQNKLSSAAAGQLSPNPLMLAQRKLLSPKFSVGRFAVSRGTLNFIDKSAGDKELKVRIQDVYLKIDNLNFKGSGFQITSFEFRGKVPWREGQKEGKIEIEGWIDFAKKDMKAAVNISDIDGVYLYPYYSQWVDLEKARIESAKLNFTSNITGLNNNLTAECHLELTDIVRKPRAPEELSQKEERITNTIIDTFKAVDQGKIILDFTYRTKMNRPEFGFGVISMAFQNKLNNGLKDKRLGVDAVVKIPVHLVEGTVKGAADISKAAIAGTSGIAIEVKKALQAAFTREPEEKDN